EAMRVEAPLPALGADEIGELERHINVLVSRVAEQTEALDRLAATDGLTELPNRRRLDAFMASLRERGKVEGADRRRAGEGGRTADGAGRSGPTVACVLIDVDFFKRYNDRYGHAAGDRVLRAVADALKTSVRGEGDLACRYGGEEFVLVLPDTGLEGAEAVAERARRAVESLAIPHAASEVAAVVTLSAGVAAAPRDETFDPAALLAAADAALYEAKGAGRNRVLPSRGW
ncbi:MAG: GGDEF domain-containing protein, partial [Spirochaetaceae bacterium]|nr:GGDEF domain-containing protein [Spirochaetaceae bacterium]